MFPTGVATNWIASRVTFPGFFRRRACTAFPPARILLTPSPRANVHYGFNVLDLMKIDGMYAYARARNLEESLPFRKFDGLELNFNTPGPLGTLVQGTVSYALDGNIARYNSRWAAYILDLQAVALNSSYG
jgi:hypothetical protein